MKKIGEAPIGRLSSALLLCSRLAFRAFTVEQTDTVIMIARCALLAGCSAAGDRGRHSLSARRHQRLAHGSQPANGGRALATLIKSGQ